MFSYLYHTFVFDPLYNGLIGLMDLLPWIDAGVAVILFTCIVKFILYPLSKKGIISQIRMKRLEPEMARVRAQFKDNQQMLGMKMMELYKVHKVNPFSMILPLLIQLPILWAIYYIFTRSGLPEIRLDLLYSFIDAPTVNVNFLGLLDITKKSIILSLVAALSQYVYLDYTARKQKQVADENKTKNQSAGKDFASEFGKAMTNQMKYVLPVFIFIFAYSVSAALGIYWTVSNLFTLAQDYYIRKRHQADETPSPTPTTTSA